MHEIDSYRKSLSYKCKLTLFKITVKLLSLLPLAKLQKLGAHLGHFYYQFQSREKNVIRTNLQLCYPHLSQQKRDMLALNTMRQTFMLGMEMPYVFQRDLNQCINQIKRVEGENHIQEALNNHQGVLMVGPHIGSWEFAVLYLASRFPTHILYTPAKQAIVDEMLYEKRIRSGVYMEPADKSGVKNICRSLQKGALVIVLTDQVPKDKGAHYVPFFNRPAKTMSLPSKLFQRYQPRLILGCCIRDHSGQFEIHLKPLHDHIKQNRPYCQSDDPFAECLNRAYEQLINRYPEQYQWSYKRFKQPPQGYINPYNSDYSFNHNRSQKTG